MKARFKARFVLAGELEVLQDGVVEVDDGGVVVGVGKYTGGTVADLGNVVLMPQLVNAHVHVLDAAIIDRDDMYIDDLVGWPYGVKYRLVKEHVSRGRHIPLLRKVAERMRRYGIGCALIYAEYAARDVESVYREYGVEAIVFQEAHGDFPDYPNVQVASPLDHPVEYLRELRRRYRLVSTHVSETEDCHEGGDLELALKELGADVLVHLVHVTDEEISSIPPEKTIVVNPRANAYFVGRVAPVHKLLSLKPLLGTDNVFMNEPDPWAEMKFLHAYSATAGWSIGEREILAMATVWAWEKIRCIPPIEPGRPLRALAVVAPYAGDKVLKYLVKRVAHSDLIAFVEGSRITPT
ncbi:Cytosine deaminase-related metal-dependent hydrolase [Pyrobaculum oguniense TE7]|uniref:Cytosine deaminase-related metal-dependent hydrolase n=1 Tax=Pyrobaculum oguniense (strain DSM 13380 / JCM 10595 / TE7) TaxID=698757 RepID=H6QDY6_PYROT|nr:Cytosine deaminase-related metal-dependent hydrolase [Pyrobaculum oguniense TE7]